MQRRVLTAALASASVALGGAIAATTVPAQAVPDPTSPLVLDVPDRVVVKTYGGRIYSDFDIRMVAQGERFEIHAKRAQDYTGPITAAWKQWDPAGDPLPDVPLPPDAMSSWQGLDGFAAVKIKRDGKVIRRTKATGCFNGNARKVGPAGPVSNPYPWGCPWNPYTLGSVMGVAEDYSTSLLPEWGTNFRLKPGTYELVGNIAPKWRQVFGISEADGQVVTELVVKKARQRRWRRESVADAAARAQRGTEELEATTEAPTARSQGDIVQEFAPDLRSLPAFDISLNGKGNAMRFGATVWNGGHGPLVIEGFREEHDHDPTARSGEEHADHMTAYQYYFDGNGNQTGYDQVGQFTYHEANHNHWHFEDFARYRLFAPDAQNPEQPGDAVVKSTKASFCLVATDAVDYTVPNADWRPEYTDLSSQCGGRRSQMLREVLANGSGDTYHQYRAGQAFRVGNVPDGVYFIAVEANPDDENGRNLQERDYSNNDSYRKVELYTTPRGVRRVRTFQVGDVEEFSFDGFRRR